MEESSKIKYAVRQSPALLALRFFVMSVVFSLVMSLVSVIGDAFWGDGRDVFGTFLEYDTVIIVFLLLLQIVLSIYVLLGWMKNVYKIKDNSVIWTRGILFVRETEFILNPNMTISHSQNITEKYFDYGSIDINGQFQICGINNPKYLMEILKKQQNVSFINNN